MKQYRGYLQGGGGLKMAEVFADNNYCHVIYCWHSYVHMYSLSVLLDLSLASFLSNIFAIFSPQPSSILASVPLWRGSGYLFIDLTT